MKKYFMTLAAVLCCAMMATVFNSCDPDKETYVTSYMYEVKMDYQASVCYADDARNAINAFNNAIGTDGTTYKYHQTNQDSQMKSACEAVKKQFAGTESTYMKFDLYRITSSAEPGFEQKEDLIGTYVMGQALTKPFVSYSISTNQDEAYAALEAKKNDLDEKVYKASMRTLRTLLGKHTSSTSQSGTVSSNISSVFDTYFKNAFIKVWEDSQANDTYIASTCDSIAAAHASDTLAVQAKVTVSKTGFLNNQVTEIWSRTFTVNVE